MNNLLIVDDNDMFRDNLKEALAEITTAQINEASNGVDAINKADAIKPDLIIMDIMMPGMSGWEALYEIRLMDDLSTVPVIFCSGSYEDQQKFASSPPPNSYFISKPADMEKMMDLIEGVITSGELNAV